MNLTIPHITIKYNTSPQKQYLKPNSDTNPRKFQDESALKLTSNAISASRLAEVSFGGSKAEVSFGGSKTEVSFGAKKPLSEPQKATPIRFWELSDEEFLRIRKQVKNAIERLPKEHQYLDYIPLDKYNIFLVLKLLSTKDKLSNPLIAVYTPDIISAVDTPDTLKTANEVIFGDSLLEFVEKMYIAKKSGGDDYEEFTTHYLLENYERLDKELRLVCVEILGHKHWLNSRIKRLRALFDKETFNNMIYKEDVDVLDYLFAADKFNAKDYELLDKIANHSTDTTGKKFPPADKLEFLNIIAEFNRINLSKKPLEDMAERGVIDKDKIAMNLFKKALLEAGITKEEFRRIPSEAFERWDKKFLHLLGKTNIIAKNMTGQTQAYKDLIRAAVLEPDFFRYIHDESNIYGKSNAITREQLDSLGLDYEKWLHPSKANEVKIRVQNASSEELKLIAEMISQIMTILLDTPAANVVKKQFPQFVKDDSFVLPSDYITNKGKILKLLETLTNTKEKGPLAKIWNRAKVNMENKKDIIRAVCATQITSIHEELIRIKKQTSALTHEKHFEPFDLTIRAWSRIPQNDIAQGNYSACCLALGSENFVTLPYYFMNTMFQMIEIFDNTQNEPIGNALCYFAKDEDENPILIIDNTEIKYPQKPTKDAEIQVRNAILEYARNLAQEVSGNEDTPVYMGVNNNDIVLDDLKKCTLDFSLVGGLDAKEIYLDIFDGWTDEWQKAKNCMVVSS